MINDVASIAEKDMSQVVTGQNLVFIAGCPRSGTTFLQRLLSVHPLIRTGQESHLFAYIGTAFRLWQNQVAHIGDDPRGGIGLPCYLSERQFRSNLKRFLDALLFPIIAPLSSDMIFVEKTPSNALYIDVIAELLPRARIIHLLRDTRDVVASMLAAHRTWGSHWALSNARSAARLWIKHVTAAKESARHLPLTQYREIRYEELVAEPEQELEKLSQFLGITWTEDDLQRAVQDNSFEAAKATGGSHIEVGGIVASRTGSTVREPHGFVRKGKAGSWRQDLNFLEKAQVWSVARHQMKSAGYNWKYPW